MDILTIMAGIEAAIAAAPKVVEVATKGKELITALAGAGVISDAKQDQLHARVDTVMNAYLAGEVPPALQVEPDPVTAPPVTEGGTEAPATTSEAPGGGS